MEFYIGQTFKSKYPPEAAMWCNENNAVLEYNEDQDEYEIKTFIYIPTVQDYDNLMEQHLKEERIARGYTKREPSDYVDSTIERWAQDAQDWIAHRDEVMLYALEIENHYQETGEAPTLAEFKENLPKITWTIE